ncbi:MAG: hypothetical protein MdMp014T_0629 [Treponematales bacterium]
MEQDIDLGENDEEMDGLGYVVKTVVKFTSATAGTVEAEIVRWTGTWPAELEARKAEIEAEIAAQEDTFPYTYNTAAHTGTITMMEISVTEKVVGEVLVPFTVNVSAKTLTVGDGDSVLHLVE